jgi:predicted AlkP superfamily pyrophosphatase or phosphodiesterase
MRVPTKLAVAVLVLVGAPGAFAAVAADATPAQPVPMGAPKLVVLVAIDQMRADYEQMYGRAWSQGLHRLFTRGAVFRRARYPYLETITCAGHSTLGTGAFPRRHGMILNAWWDESAGKLVECTEDPAASLVLYGPGQTGRAPALARGHSARLLLAPTLAQTMRTGLSPPARVVSLSSKARSAIGMVGPAADLVTWYEGGGVWATSGAYATAPNPLVVGALKALTVPELVAQPWTRLLPAARYRFTDEAPAERLAISYWSRSFPHALVPPAGAPVVAPDRASPLSAWDKSPFPDEVLASLARAAVSGMALGRQAETDFLAISFSALDTVGHDFGPRSHEVQDVLARLDRLLGELLQALDAQVGAGRYVVALSADHGVAPLPEQLSAEGQDAGRVPIARVEQAVESAVAAELGASAAATVDAGAPARVYLARVLYTDIYLRAGVYDRLRARPGAVARVLAAIRGVPGVAGAYATDDLRDPARAPDAAARAAAFSHYPGRSGQLILIPKRNWITTSSGTTHGSLSDYDQRVPLVLYGAGIRPGRFDRAVTPADIAPTLAALVGLTLPQSDGSPLREAMSPRRQARQPPPAATAAP